ncbi:MAG: hypothetical protein ACOC2Y_06430 [Spirochaetota bacterium]
MGGPTIALRFAAPHRVFVPFLAGTAYAVREIGGPSASVLSPAGGALPRLGATLALGLLLTVAVALLRLWALGEGRATPFRQSLIMGGTGVSSGASVAILIVAGSWIGVVLLLAVLTLEWLFFLPPLALCRRFPCEPELVAIEGVLAPLLGFVVIAARMPLPWSFVAVTGLAGASVAIAVFLQDPVRDALPMRSVADLVPPVVAGAVALALATAALALVLAGAGPQMRAEHALLATPVAVMAAVFGWLSLADPRPDWRYRRLERLLGVCAFTLYGGLVLVLLFA